MSASPRAMRGSPTATWSTSGSREVIATAPADEWVERINEAGGMCERLRGVGDAWRDPLLAERGLVGELDGGPFDFPLPVVSLARPGKLVPGPSLGEHTDEVLAEL